MNQSTDRTQDTIFGKLPRSQFLGIAIGYALGLTAEGLLHMDNMLFEIIGIAIGLGFGYWIDHKSSHNTKEAMQSLQQTAESTDEV